MLILGISHVQLISFSYAITISTDQQMATGISDLQNRNSLLIKLEAEEVALSNSRNPDLYDGLFRV